MLRVSLKTMPHLRDHCLFQQRDDWPDDVDRWPVMPATALIEHMIDAAEHTAPERRAVAVHELRLNRWLVAEPPVDVPITAVSIEPNRVRVEIGSYCQAVIELGDRYPSDGLPLQSFDPRTERVCDITAEQLYGQRWMFHGPRYQGITHLTAVGDQHIRGRFTALESPGAVLDNVGQLLGYWVKATQPHKPVLFPWRARKIRFFSAPPPVGTVMTCVGWIRLLTTTTVEIDAELTRDGYVWARIDGFQGRRFDIDRYTDAVYRFPDRRAVSQLQPGGWVLLFERWSGVSSRELVARMHLSAAERAEYDRCPLRLRRQWLLCQIAAKDAARWWLWRDSVRPVFPAEIQITVDECGRPQVSGLHGRILPRLCLSVAHCAQVAVALAQPCAALGGGGVGIAVEEIVECNDPAGDCARSEEEAALLDECCAQTGETRALWSTRFRTAKQAARKAAESLCDAPQGCLITAATATELTVLVRPDRASKDPACSYQVCCEQISNVHSISRRQYVVAWTTGDGKARGSAVSVDYLPVTPSSPG